MMKSAVVDEKIGKIKFSKNENDFFVKFRCSEVGVMIKHLCLSLLPIKM